MPAISQAPNGPFAAGSTPVVMAQIVDADAVGIPATNLNSLTLSIVDTLTQTIVNGCDQVNILNTGRGTVDAQGNVTIALLAADTSMAEVPGVQQIERSLVLDWTFNAGNSVGRGQVNFTLVSLAAP